LNKKIERQLTFSLEGTDCIKVEGINVASDVDPGSDISVFVTCEEIVMSKASHHAKTARI
jgi:hypothetical protein